MTLRRYMQSDSMDLTRSHVPNLVRRGFLKIDAAQDEIDALSGAIENEARVVWGRMRDWRHELPLGHDGYLKLWALGKPSIPTDVLFVDEAQDLNPVLVGVIKRQLARWFASATVISKFTNGAVHTELPVRAGNCLKC